MRLLAHLAIGLVLSAGLVLVLCEVVWRQALERGHPRAIATVRRWRELAERTVRAHALLYGRWYTLGCEDALAAGATSLASEAERALIHHFGRLYEEALLARVPDGVSPLRLVTYPRVLWWRQRVRKARAFYAGYHDALHNTATWWACPKPPLGYFGACLVRRFLLETALVATHAALKDRPPSDTAAPEPADTPAPEPSP